jgi:5-methylcytosine-specific restriction endonuclease McrA
MIRGARGWSGFTTDHVIAVALGGSDQLDNLVACCRHCNSRKHTMDADTFYEHCEVWRDLWRRQQGQDA